MAINFNIATPGLLANPQPYVNTGLLAAQGPQAARLRAPVAQMPAQGNLGTALDGAADAFTDMRKDQMRAEAHKDLMLSRAIARDRDLATKSLRESQLVASERSNQNWAQMSKMLLPDTLDAGSNAATEARARANATRQGPDIVSSESLSPDQKDVISTPLAPLDGTGAANMTQFPDPLLASVQSPIPGTSFDEADRQAAVVDPKGAAWRKAASEAPDPQNSSRLFFKEGAPNRYTEQSLSAGDKFGNIRPVGLEATPELRPEPEPEPEPGPGNYLNQVRSQILKLPEGQRAIIFTRLKAAIGAQDNEGMRAAFKIIQDNVDPAALQKAAEPMFDNYNKDAVDFNAALTSWRTMTEVYNSGDLSQASNVVFIKSLNGILEPGMAVTDGEAKAMAGGQSVETSVGGFVGAFTQGKPLTLEVREQLMRAAQSSMKARLNAQEDMDTRYKPLFETLRVPFRSVLTEDNLEDIRNFVGQESYDHITRFGDTDPSKLTNSQLDTAFKQDPIAYSKWYYGLSPEQQRQALSGSLRDKIIDQVKLAKEIRAKALAARKTLGRE
jgi:hypothetical protein